MSGQESATASKQRVELPTKATPVAIRNYRKTYENHKKTQEKLQENIGKLYENIGKL